MRVHNFGAGPCTLPLPVLEEAQRELLDFAGTGMSVMEISHRSPEYQAVHEEAIALARKVSGAPDDFEVLLVQGGATLQFAMVPLNLLGKGDQAGYVVAGAWGSKALGDAAHHGKVYAAWDGAGSNYIRMPTPGEIDVRPGSRYLHVTTNETMGGIRMVDWPGTDVPLVADVSSEYFARPLPWDRFDVVYGGVQKNLAPSGMAVVFVRRTALAQRDLASYLRYDVHAAHRSLYNTPPMFSVYLMGMVLRMLDDLGGAAGLERISAGKADLLYGAIDESGGYYRSPVDEACRSRMNVVFRLPTEDAETRFLRGAREQGMVGLEGHRSVGGCRASLYAALPYQSVEALVEYMGAFSKGC
ncbi:MAG: 3-phosphoserine/phosphohydroxythreonine transaminase [Acidimicrobiia bacterium]